MTVDETDVSLRAGAAAESRRAQKPAYGSDARNTGEAPAKAKRTRDPSIDVLRGWAMVLMITSHIGASSRLSMLVNVHVWVDAAGPFILLAGLVLGMIVRAGKPERAVWPRARQFWVIHVVMMFTVLVVHETTGRLNSPSVAGAGGLFAVLWKVPALRLQALDFMNILPLFIVYFLVAPPLLAAMRRGYTGLVLAASFALWALTEASPGWFRFTDLACGTESFQLPAWQFPFVIGLSFGFHVRALARTFWPRHRGWLVPATATMVVGVFILAQLQRHALARFGATLPASTAWLFSKETWGPVRAIYTIGTLLIGYVALEWVRTRRPGWFRPARTLELMGSRSLYCFLVHLPLALLASALSLETRAEWIKDAAALSAIVAVYELGRHQVLARYIPS